MKRERKQTEEKTIKQKRNLDLDGLGNSQAIQIFKKKKLNWGDSLLGRCILREKARVWLDTNFAIAKGNEGSIHESLQSSHRSQGKGWNHTRKISEEIPFLMVWILSHSWETHESVCVLYQQEHCQFGLKRKETGWNQRRVLDSQNSIGRKQADKMTQLQTCYSSKKGKMTTRVEFWAKRPKP